MKANLNRIIAAIAVLAFAMGAAAQNGTLTPYSRYGFGVLNDNATAAQRSMGGVGYAMNSGRQINVKNPASYAAIDSMTFLFDMGLDMVNLFSKEGDASEKSMSGGLDYITMAFPIGKIMGASVGLLPFSSTGYSFGQSIENGSVSRTGAGDISMLYAGLAIKPFKNAYIGVNGAYMFGSTLNDVYAANAVGTTTLFERYMKVRDWRLDIGVQYALNFGRDHRAVIGLTYSPAKSFHGETFGLYYDYTLDQAPDTTGYTSLKGKYSMPATYGAGISYSLRDNLLIAADFTYQPWKNAKYASLENFEVTELDNRWKVSLGAQFTPHPRGNYFQCINYRAGVYYNHDYLMVRGNSLREIGATIGFGFPIPGFKTVMSLGLEYKNRQATPNPLIKEQYLNLTLGINFNELWFHTSKIY